MTFQGLRWNAVRLAALVIGLSMSVELQAQGATVTGKVTSEQGQNLYGANVVIAELNVSVATNEAGVYRFALPAERVRGQTVSLRVRAIGYQPQVKQVTLRAGTITQNFEMKIDINKLQEVIITGTTGATETGKLGFKVDRVEVADIPVPSTNALTQLQGKVTGAQIVMPNGRPGTNAQIVLRGPKSIDATGRSQQPLMIVDGVVMTGALQDLNPQDIESIEVVKGAAAASTYGSRAGNGVIAITTKSGKNAQGGVRFNVRSEYGFSDIQTEYPFAQRHILMMNATNDRFCIKVQGYPACSRTVNFEEEARRVNEQGKTASLSPYNFERDGGIALALTKPELKGTFQINQWPVRYNPIAQTVTNGLFNNSNLDMVGKFGNTGFFASVSNLIQEGSIRYLDGYNRNSARLNLDQQVGENLNVALQTFYSRATTYPNGEFFRLTRVPAGVNLLRTDKEGRLFIRSNPLNQGQQNENPLYPNQSVEGKTEADRYLGALTARYTPLSWLDFDANASIDRRRDDGYTLRDRGFRVTSLSQSTNYLGNLYFSNSLDQSYNMSVGATARQHDPLGIKDLDVRWSTRYAYEQQDFQDQNTIGGTTLAVPGLLAVGNVTVLSNPGSSSSSVRAVGVLGGAQFDYKGRYIVDAVFRRDGSSLFGSEQRWHPYYRTSLAYRMSDEPWWPWKGAVNDLKFRAAVGTAGGRPSFVAQYETFSIGSGGTITGAALGNRNLKPEITTETEYGIDAELFSKYGLSVTYARDITKEQIIRVPPPAASGFSSQWKNAGTMDNKTWEISLNFPIITNKNIVWTSRVSYDRNRTFITGLGVPPFFQSDAGSTFRFAPGERIGTIWGKYFIRNCGQLPAAYASQCGASGSGKQYQPNNEGYIVWTGGFSPTEGIQRNLWQSSLPGCVKGGATVNVTGEVACKGVGGTVNNPWAIPATHWGMPMVIRDSTGNPVLQRLGNTQPDMHLAWTTNFQYKKFSLYVLMDGSFGQRVFNEEIHWSLGDFNVRYEDQDGKNVETAKPVGYYWRAPQPDNGSGVGGFYDVLGSNNQTTQKASYAKLRELSASFALGRIRGVGDWSISVIGRNLYTISDFLGWDPETGGGGTNLNSGAVGSVAAYQYPQTRQFTVGLATRF